MQPGGREVSTQVLFSNNVAYSSCMAFLQMGEDKACLTVVGSTIVRSDGNFLGLTMPSLDEFAWDEWKRWMEYWKEKVQ